jgi:hypothetical protein
VDEPIATRPHMPGYGIAPADGGHGLLPWSWAEERLTQSRNYWVSTTRHGGRPHAMPVWGVWFDGAFWFSTGSQTVKARNLKSDGRCSVSTERADEAVIVEGFAELVAVNEAPVELNEGYARKYGMGYPTDSDLFRVTPGMAFGFIEREDAFGATATRWLFRPTED